MNSSRTDKIREVKALCQHFMSARFPTSCKKTLMVKDETLILLDADVGILIMRFAESQDNRFHKAYIKDLQEGQARLEKVLPLFEAYGIDEEGRQYFELLHESVIRALEVLMETPE